MTSFLPHWRRVLLRDALKVKYGKALPTAERDPTAAFPVVGSAGRMTFTHTALVNGPVVIIGRKGNAGHVQLEESPCWPIDTTYFAEIPDDFDGRFLLYQLRQARLDQLDSSTTTPSLRREDLESQNLCIPPLDQQRRIVDLLEDHLSRLDAADRQMSQSLSRLAGLRERTVIDALTGAAEEDRIKVPPEPAGTADWQLASLPRGWQWSRLGDVADVVGGVTKDAKKQNDPSYVEVPYLRVANVQRGRLALNEVMTIRVPTSKAEALALQPGDVLLNEGGDRDKLARGWVWEGQIAGCIHQNHVFRARIREPRLDPYFLSWTANTFGGKWAERNGKQSVNLASISLSVIKKMPVIVPPADEAARITARLGELQSKFDRIGSAIDEARTRSGALRRSLLAAAFSGRLTANSDAEDLVSP